MAAKMQRGLGRGLGALLGEAAETSEAARDEVRSLKLTPAELMAFLNDPKNAFSASGQDGPKSEDTGKEENAHEEN